MAMDKFRFPPLPSPPKKWDGEYMRQVLRVMENYFSQLDSNTPNHAEKYTANQFTAVQRANGTGGTITGTDIVATNSMDTNFLTSHSFVTGYESANGLATNALISYGHKNGRQISDDIMVGNVYANYLYGDGSNIQRPYAQLYSDTTQTQAAVDVAAVLSFDGNDFPDGITIVSGSRMTVSVAGVYCFTPSMQLESNSTNTEYVNIWYRKNGVDITRSNAKFGIPPRKSPTIPGAIVASSPFIIQLNAGDYVETAWATGNITDVRVVHTASVAYSAGVTPAIPDTPAAFMNISLISSKIPQPTRVAPLPVFGFGEIGTISVYIR